MRCGAQGSIGIGRGQTLHQVFADLMPGERQTERLTVTNTTKRALSLFIQWSRPSIAPAPRPATPTAFTVSFGDQARFDASSAGGTYRIPGGLPRGATRDLSLTVALAATARNDWQSKTVHFHFNFIAE